MTESIVPDQRRLAGWTRLLVAVAAIVLACPLIVASGLRPSDRGFGTHQQLGLPPCTFYVLSGGLRCPSCGMTTSWSCTVRGRLIAAVQANTGGTLLALLNLAFVPWLMLSSIRGRWLIRSPSTSVTAWILIGTLIVTLIDWGVRLM